MAEENNENTQKSEIAKREEEILEFWKENEIFKKSLEKDAPEGEFVFYEGPPTANGRPGIHHLESRAFKDVIPRYKTMRGFYVRRKAGWDTHGLPVELEVEKELGLKSKKEIEEYGIAEFNKKCKESVWKYVDEWEKFTDRTAFWIDQKNPYITYKPEYMESVWNIVKEINKQKLLYKDYKVLPWCPRCQTALSSHELAQGYKDVTDESVYVKFKIKNPEKHNLPENTYLLAWTTTPWTLPGNVALAIKSTIDYAIVRMMNDELGIMIVAKDRINDVLKDKEYEIIKELGGKKLVGIEYEPLYPYFADTLPENQKDKLKNAYKVYSADFVNTDDGTGIVHTAVMYGADDFALGNEKDLPKHHLVNEAGRFVSGTGFLEGKKVRAMSEEIIKDLGNKIFSEEKIKHSYPHCWRCNTALIYFARDSWYIQMSKLRDKLIKENKGINWVPEHIKEGRFGEWLSDVKDWAISRERYWGTPLPIWQRAQTNAEKNADKHRKKTDDEFVVIGSIEELKNYAKKSGNKYFVMRHGEAEHNVKNIVSSKVDNPHHLTDKGKKEAEKAAKKLKKEKIDLIFASPFVRTKETVEIVINELGLEKDIVVYDEKLRELDAGDFNNKSASEYSAYFASKEEKYTKPAPNGENLMQIKKRMMDFISETEEKHKNKNILIITHEWPAFLLFAGSNGFDIKESSERRNFYNIENGTLATSEFMELQYIPFPHNENYELDLHRPYIDEIELIGKDGNKLQRVKEVMDVWFDSGAMPFAQDHYPFENKKWVEGKGYPADYISEAIDQTRGWFYTLHAIGVLMGRGKAYKNVISLGHLLDKKGKKMSKSVGNVVSPWEMSDKYGVDALRFWMYTINQPGEPKNFDERTVDEVIKKIFNLLNNVVKFYELYEGNEKRKVKSEKQESTNVLDKWILARLNQLIVNCTNNLDNYHILEPARDIREFIADLSQWYIRRSRDRFKATPNQDDSVAQGTDGEAKVASDSPKATASLGSLKQDKENALATTQFVLLELSKLMAPFTPFIAEQVYQKVKGGGGKESVHLEDWPVFQNSKFKIQNSILDEMEEVRKIVSLGLEVRSSAGIKVRQPLAELKLKVKSLKFKDNDGLLKLIRDEVNVKEILFDEKIENEVELDANITPELQEEGDARELIRTIQSMRKKEELTPSDVVALAVETDEKGKKLVEKFADEIKNTALLKEIKFESVDGAIPADRQGRQEEISINSYNFKLKIQK